MDLLEASLRRCLDRDWGRFYPRRHCGEEYAEALSNGTIVAIFDKIPYLRLCSVNNKNCAKYKMVEPIHKAGGLGFERNFLSLNELVGWELST